MLTALSVAWTATLACGGDEGGAGGGGSNTGGSGGASGAGGGATGGMGGNAGDAAVSGLEQSLADHGFETATGAFRLLDLSDCCAAGKSCSGNNPSSPYGSFALPRAPGQTVANTSEGPDGLASAFRLRADEAVIYVGTSPPAAKYFGFTPYLFDRQGSGGARKPVFASLSETLNHLVLAVGGEPDPFEAKFALVAAADQTTLADAKAALVDAGIEQARVNELVFDPTLSTFGLDEAADTFGVLFRVALFDDPAQGKAYLDALPGVLLRATPKNPKTPNPAPAPASRPKNTGDAETQLGTALDALEAAVIAQYPGYTSKSMIVTKGTPDPVACIQGTAFCAGDNRDTNYPSTLPQVLFASADDFFVVIGVDHTQLGKTSYANFSVYAVEHLVGVVSVADTAYAGSATGHLPSNPDAGKLFAWKVARDCTGDPHCLAVPDAGCPTGLETGKAGTITFRTYLEPKTKTAPDPSTLVESRVLRFTKN